MFDVLIRYSWVALIAIFYIFSAYITIKNNSLGGKWFWVMVMVNAMPLWALVSRYSKDIVLDAFIFDLVLVLGYSFGLLYFTHTLGKLGVTNWLGITLMFLGLFLFKRGL